MFIDHSPPAPIRSFKKEGNPTGSATFVDAMMLGSRLFSECVMCEGNLEDQNSDWGVLLQETRESESV